MTDIMSDDGYDGITTAPANTHHLRLQQKEHPAGDTRPFWSRQDICNTQDIITGFHQNRARGWYESSSPGDSRRAQKVAQRRLGAEKIATRDWAYESDSEMKESKLSGIDLSKAKISIRRRGKANDDKVEKESIADDSKKIESDDTAVKGSADGVAKGFQRFGSSPRQMTDKLEKKLSFTNSDDDASRPEVESSSMSIHTHCALQPQ